MNLSLFHNHRTVLLSYRLLSPYDYCIYYILIGNILSEILLDNTKSSAKYTFERDTGRLSKFSLGIENDTITVDHFNQSYPTLLTHSNGKQLKITYNDDKVIYIDLIAQDDSIVQSW